MASRGVRRRGILLGMRRRASRPVPLTVVTAVVALSLVAGAPGVARGAPAPRDDWRWPVSPVRVVRPYEAPAHRYGSGHRGIDLAIEPGGAVHAPASGVVAFSGVVVDRGVVTIDHGDGHVTTLEPVVDAPPTGSAVARGDPVGVVALGGHTAPGAVHFGVRLHGEYVNPMLLLGGVPRAVLLPCC